MHLLRALVGAYLTCASPPQSSGRGMQPNKARAMWKIAVDPDNVQPDDIEMTFYDSQSNRSGFRRVCILHCVICRNHVYSSAAVAKRRASTAETILTTSTTGLTTLSTTASTTTRATRSHATPTATSSSSGIPPLPATASPPSTATRRRSRTPPPPSWSRSSPPRCSSRPPPSPSASAPRPSLRCRLRIDLSSR